MNKLKLKIWRKVKSNDYKSVKQCIKILKKKNVILSPWIENIYFNKKNKIKVTKKSYNLYRLKVSDLGCKKACKLKEIYKLIKKNKYSLVPPEVAIRSRLLYLKQKKGEWIRFATPFYSMIDTDKVPHLPKFGSALGFYFLETYWSYPDAIFHPHNEFVITD